MPGVLRINSSLNGLSFAQDTEGNWGYKTSGADTVVPFKSGDFILNKGEMYSNGKIIQFTTGTTNEVSLGYSSYKEGWTVFLPDDDMVSFTVASNNRIFAGIIIYKDGTFNYAIQPSQFAPATIQIDHSKEILICIAFPRSMIGTVSNGGYIQFNY